MSYQWPQDLTLPTPAGATFLPPATVEETAWDILLALHADQRCELDLGKLASLVSVSRASLARWLELLEHRTLITGVRRGPDDELRAVLTSAGRDLLDRYWSATSGLQVGAPH